MTIEKHAKWLSQSTPEPELMNASADVASAFGSTEGLAGPIVIVLWAVVIMGLLSAARNSAYFKRMIDAFGMFAVSMYYAIHGVAAVTAFAVLSAPVYFLATAEPGTQILVGKYALYTVAGYVGLTAIGYVFRHEVLNPILANVDNYGLLPDEQSTDSDLEEGN